MGKPARLCRAGFVDSGFTSVPLCRDGLTARQMGCSIGRQGGCVLHQSVTEKISFLCKSKICHTLPASSVDQIEHDDSVIGKGIEVGPVE